MAASRARLMAADRGGLAAAAGPAGSRAAAIVSEAIVVAARASAAARRERRIVWVFARVAEPCIQRMGHLCTISTLRNHVVTMCD